MTNTLHELKNNIIEEINRITPDILEKVKENTVRKIRLCLLKDIIFKYQNLKIFSFISYVTHF